MQGGDKADPWKEGALKKANRRLRWSGLEERREEAGKGAARPAPAD